MGFAPPQGMGTTPNYKRVMTFIDATNLLNQLKAWAGVNFNPHKPPPEALDLAMLLVDKVQRKHPNLAVVRTYWCGSFTGSDEEKTRFELQLREHSCAPVVLKKPSEGGEKGVDMAVAIEILVNAFHRNFDIGILVAGDADYERLLLEAKRYGVVMWGAFFKTHGLSTQVQLAVDTFDDFESLNGLQEAFAKLKNACPAPTPRK